MPSQGDLIEIILAAELLGQQVINVRQAVILDVTGDADLQFVIDAFEDDILPPIAAQLSQFYEYQQITINNLTDDTEFAQRPVSIVGTDTGQPLPPHTAVSFKMQRGNKTTRNGYLRQAGIVEGAQDAGMVVEPYLSQFAIDFAWLLSEIQKTDGGDSITFRNVIMGRLPNGDYDLPRWQYPVAAEVQEVVTTQRSRKIGVGR